ncbi:MAG: hypothetical protein U0165_14365 [Polyangiaceae bacterium]
MPQHTCYVVIDSSNEYMNANILACSDPALDSEELNDSNETLALLLQAGWVPLRETPMGMTRSRAVVLAILVKEI